MKIKYNDWSDELLVDDTPFYELSYEDQIGAARKLMGVCPEDTLLDIIAKTLIEIGDCNPVGAFGLMSPEINYTYTIDL